jgi:glycosyltransferase involved in cell wall biosynthesis
MLADSLAGHPEVELRTFTWRNALLSRYDVFHAHWPEVHVTGKTPLRAAVFQLLFAALLLRLRLQRIPLVRTLHNVHLPEGISRREVFLLRWAERRTALWIRLNRTTALPPGQPVETILHGHYRDWFARFPRPAAVPGRFVLAGLVRRYKNAAGLIRAFHGTGAQLAGGSVRIAGLPSSEELAAELRREAADDPRISLRLEFLSEADLAAEISAAELVVLPYREMHNSGAALSALSLARPVLVPDNEVNRVLAEEVGPGWVFRYDGELTGRHLLDALDAYRSRPPGNPPALTARDWDVAAPAHLAAYRRALALRRG